MTTLPPSPAEVAYHKHFLLGTHVSWTDIMRRKRNRETLRTLHERLPEAKDQAEKQHISEAIALIKDEVDQWTII
jgi:hypothetical protein